MVYTCVYITGMILSISSFFLSVYLLPLIMSDNDYKKAMIVAIVDLAVWQLAIIAFETAEYLNNLN